MTRKTLKHGDKMIFHSGDTCMACTIIKCSECPDNIMYEFENVCVVVDGDDYVVHGVGRLYLLDPARYTAAKMRNGACFKLGVTRVKATGLI